MSLCPCGSQKTYGSCCGLFIETEQKPQTPEQLMRSRYAAYSQGKTDYIKNTMKGTALIGFDELEAQKWANQVTWLGLEVLQAEPTTTDIGFVEFIVRLMEHGKQKIIHELSEFHKEQGIWFYVSGINKQASTKKNTTTIARNGACPCGSGKKFKNCHAK